MDRPSQHEKECSLSYRGQELPSYLVRKPLDAKTYRGDDSRSNSEHADGCQWIEMNSAISWQPEGSRSIEILGNDSNGFFDEMRIRELLPRLRLPARRNYRVYLSNNTVDFSAWPSNASPSSPATMFYRDTRCACTVSVLY